MFSPKTTALSCGSKSPEKQAPIPGCQSPTGRLYFTEVFFGFFYKKGGKRGIATNAPISTCAGKTKLIQL